MTEGLDSKIISTKQERIAKLASDLKGKELYTLAHHIDLAWMKEAYRRTRKDGALGVDGQSAEQYSKDLEENLKSLLERMKSGQYQAPHVRRVYIPKGEGKELRALGVPTFEDKIAQRAVVMVLEPVYEQEFSESSYGFRPRRDAHQALEALQKHAWEMGGGWVVEVDIRKCFDELDHVHLQHIVRQRVADGVLLRLIGKWLNAGILDKGQVVYPKAESPQGGVISPMAANIYLNEVMDQWFEREVKPRLSGKAHLVRYADDMVMVFECEQDADKVLEVLPKRFGKYGLRLHPDKTRKVNFRRPWLKPPSGGVGGSRPETFSFLGFVHFWGRTRSGKWAVKRKTDSSRFTRALKRTSSWCRTHRHDKVAEQHKMLSLKLRGHYQYYGLVSNAAALYRFQFEVIGVWRKWLNRRSQKARMTWEKMTRLLKRYPLPCPAITHPYRPKLANP